MTDKKEGRSRGFGFVSYETPLQAQEAIKRINGKSVLGKRLKVELKSGKMPIGEVYKPDQQHSE